MADSRRALAAVAPPLAIAVVALALRLWHPSPFVTWDEPNWTYRSLKFLSALESGRPQATYLSAHPGVATMWAGAVGIASRASGDGGGADRWGWVDELPAYDEDDGELLRRIMPWWPAARTGVAFLTAALVVAAYLPARRLFGAAPAFAAGVLLAADPWLLGHSRVLHLDAVLALSLLVSVLAATVRATGAGGRGWLVAGGVFAGVAVAEKSPALAIAPFTLALLLAPRLPRFERLWGADGSWSGARPDARGLLVDLSVWAACAAAAYFVLWPALWAAPMQTLERMLAYARQSAGGPREAVFFAGRVTPDPGPLLYPVAVAMRATPLVLLGLLAAIGGYRRAGARSRFAALALVAWAAFFLVVMALGAKKFERYALPAMPPLDVVAGFGLAWACAAAAAAAERRRPRPDDAAPRTSGAAPPRTSVAAPPRASGAAPTAASSALAWCLLTVVLLVHTVVVARRAPYYLAAYNPLLGGGPAAARLLPVGWGEGMDRVGLYLNGLPDADNLTVATPSVALVAPLVAGHTVPARDWQSADYVVLYIDDVQIDRPDLVARRDELGDPVFVARLAGIDYAWVYAPGRADP